MVTQASPEVQSKPRMSAAEQEARANARAHAERVHIFAVLGRANVYTTKSKSDPSERYSLVVDGDDVHCSCPGYCYRKVCKHSQQLRNRLAREQVQAERLARPRATAADLYA